MKDLKFGPFLIDAKALLVVGFCLFVNLGSVAVFMTSEGENSVILFFIMLLLPYLLLNHIIRSYVKKTDHFIKE